MRAVLEKLGETVNEAWARRERRAEARRQQRHQTSTARQLRLQRQKEAADAAAAAARGEDAAKSKRGIVTRKGFLKRTAALAGAAVALKALDDLPVADAMHGSQPSSLNSGDAYSPRLRGEVLELVGHRVEELPASALRGRFAHVIDSALLYYDNGARWIPVNGYQFNVMAMGAVGDGLAVDTVPLRGTLVMAACFPGAAVFLPSTNATYNVDNILHVPPHCRIVIEGQKFQKKDSGGVRIKGTSGSVTEVFHISEAGPIPGYVIVDADLRTVRGYKTKFLTDLAPGGRISIGSSSSGTTYVIQTLVSDTELRLASNYSPTTTPTGAVTALTRRGTVSVQNGSAIVTGSATHFLREHAANKTISIGTDAATYEILSVDTDLQITLKTPYAGATRSGEALAKRVNGIDELVADIWFVNITLSGATTMEQVVLARNVDTLKFIHCRIHNSKRAVRFVHTGPAPGGVIATVPGANQQGGLVLDHCLLSGSVETLVLDHCTQCFVTACWFSGTPTRHLLLIGCNKAHFVICEFNEVGSETILLEDNVNNKCGTIDIIGCALLPGTGKVYVTDNRSNNPSSKGLNINACSLGDIGQTPAQLRLRNGDRFRNCVGVNLNYLDVRRRFAMPPDVTQMTLEWDRSIGKGVFVVGSPLVVGEGTQFTRDFAAGNRFTLANIAKTYTILSIEDDTHLTLTENFATAGEPAPTESRALYFADRENGLLFEPEMVNVMYEENGLDILTVTPDPADPKRKLIVSVPTARSVTRRFRIEATCG